ncbi:Crp/Fnr family transcriptional regulator [Radicibacter daui]|uniref:Crp/Fnr family transcriptional regulator n=1 Tax=Radicibacter daui TaxID=3064829 RepID=UPI004046C09B
MNKKDLLLRHYLFQDLPEDVIDRLLAMTVTRHVHAGETIFLKGDEGDTLYGVLSGKVRISVSSPTGKAVVFNIMETGDVFGEIALLDGLERTADAIAMEAGDLLMILRRDFMGLLEREPRLSIHLLKLLCERLRWTSDQIEDAVFLSLPARLAKKLISLADIYGEENDEGIRIGLDLPQHELGHMMSTSRESINKHLQAWRRAGLIDLHRKSIIIKNRQALQEVIDEDGHA